MAWPDDLYPASFRGVSFEVSGADGEFNLRHEVHEFPGRDGAVVEDLGQAPQRFTLDAFVLGDDWLDRKRRLIEACSKRGTGGVLVHPWFGAIAVFCTQCSVRESSAEGGLVRFSLSFVRVEGRPLIYDQRPPASDASEKADAVGAGAEQETADGLEVEGVPDFVRAGAGDAMAELGAFMRKLDIFRGPAEEVAAQAERISSLIDQASTLATSPVEAASTIRVAIERVVLTASNYYAALYAYESFFTLEASSLGGLTNLEVARDRNALLIVSQARQTALAGAVRVAAQIDWASYDDAIAARDRVLEALDAELDESSPQSYPMLARLRASLVAAVPPPQRDLPRIRRLQLTAATSAIELAYSLFDDHTRAGEIIERNRPEHGGRLSALSTVEVLSR